ncbi:hypothetical protein C8J56DRAFT_889771 [Mycena floridula]|nr:hypothetical protein C8J56DRAFT_889771 [Mycena floridula]
MSSASTVSDVSVKAPSPVLTKILQTIQLLEFISPSLPIPKPLILALKIVEAMEMANGGKPAEVSHLSSNLVADTNAVDAILHILGARWASDVIPKPFTCGFCNRYNESHVRCQCKDYFESYCHYPEPICKGGFGKLEDAQAYFKVETEKLAAAKALAIARIMVVTQAPGQNPTYSVGIAIPQRFQLQPGSMPAALSPTAPLVTAPPVALHYDYNWGITVEEDNWMLMQSKTKAMSLHSILLLEDLHVSLTLPMNMVLLIRTTWACTTSRLAFLDAGAIFTTLREAFSTEAILSLSFEKVKGTLLVFTVTTGAILHISTSCFVNVKGRPKLKFISMLSKECISPTMDHS